MDKRQEKSQYHLLKALAKLINTGHSLAEISISDIVTEAGVSRSTFYRNFDRKEDFLEWVADEIENGITQAVASRPSNSTEGPYHNYFRYLGQNRELFRAFLQSLSWPELADRMYATATELYRKQLKNHPTNTRPEDLARYIVGAHVAVTQAWLVDAHPRSPQEMAEILTNLTKNGLLQGLGLAEMITLPN